MERYYGSDYAPFNDVGVPGFRSSVTREITITTNPPHTSGYFREVQGRWNGSSCGSVGGLGVQHSSITRVASAELELCVPASCSWDFGPGFKTARLPIPKSRLMLTRNGPLLK